MLPESQKKLLVDGNRWKTRDPRILASHCQEDTVLDLLPILCSRDVAAADEVPFRGLLHLQRFKTREHQDVDAVDLGEL